MSDFVVQNNASGRVYPGRPGPPYKVPSPPWGEGQDEGQNLRSAPTPHPTPLPVCGAREQETCSLPSAAGRQAPRGISLIEVLVSIIVALTGVFGVFVLIPFAVRQVEIGMNREAALTLARNGMSDFDARGFQEVVNQGGIDNLRWALPDYTLGPPFYTAVAKDATLDEFFCIDPWGFSRHLLPADDPFNLTPPEFRNFPFFNPLPATFPRFPRINLFDRTNSVLSRGLSQRLFAGHDDLVTEPPTDDFSGPTQDFFSSTTGTSGRQYAGRLTWKMYVSRNSEIDDYARFYTAVSLARNSDTQDRIFDVSQSGALLTGPTTLFGGGDVELSEIDGSQVLESTVIRRGLWIMLLVHSGGNIQEVAFFRVLESDLDSTIVFPPSPPTYVRGFRVTLQGSDLDVPAGSTVSAVLMPSVIAVYERTMKFETSSDWNLN